MGFKLWYFFVFCALLQIKILKCENSDENWKEYFTKQLEKITDQVAEVETLKERVEHLEQKSNEYKKLLHKLPHNFGSNLPPNDSTCKPYNESLEERAEHLEVM